MWKLITTLTFINMNARKEIGRAYEAPMVDYLDCMTEGVLCESKTGSGEIWQDGGDI